MPLRDGTGPSGQGSMSGRAMGLGCRRGSGRAGRGFHGLVHGSLDEATERSLMERRKGFLETQLDLINKRLSSSFQDREK